MFTVAGVNASDVNDTVVASDETPNEGISVSDYENTMTDTQAKSMKELNNTINNAQSDTINLTDDYYCEDKDLENGIIISKSLTIDGQNHKLDGAGKMRIFQVTNNANVTFKNIIFLNGWTGEYGYGGAIWNNGAKNVTAINCTFEKNTATNGGAISNVNAVNSTFKNNAARHDTSSIKDYMGGAMYKGYAVNCSFVNNYAINYGGAMSEGYAVNCSFVHNSVEREGGAICDSSAVNCYFVNNTSKENGGAMDDRFAKDKHSAVNCIFVNNTATEFGGAIFYGNAIDCYFVNNTAKITGGAMCFDSAVNCSFANNSAPNGGAIYYSDTRDCYFVNNTASYGGAMYRGSAVNCFFVNNTATTTGGAVYGASAIDCSFINNAATTGGAMSGGEIYKNSAMNSYFINNSATTGGAIYNTPARDCSFINNTATTGSAMYNSTVTNCSFVNNNVYMTKIQFYLHDAIVHPNDTLLFYGLPECNLTVNVTNKDGVSKTFNCTDKGWKIENLENGIYTVKFSIIAYEINSGELEIKMYLTEENNSTMTTLKNIITYTQNTTIILNHDYSYENDIDELLKNGIEISKSVTIDGQGHKIDANGLMRIFKVTDNAKVTFKNILFLNGWTGVEGRGGAIWNNEAKNITAINCTFENNTATYGGAI